MAGIERHDSDDSHGINKMLALYLLGRIKKEDLSENDQVVMEYYNGLRFEDPKYRRQIEIEMNSLREAPSEIDQGSVDLSYRSTGRRIPLYTEEELKKAAKHKRNKPVRFNMRPLPFWLSETTEEAEKVMYKSEDYPEKGVMKISENINSSLGKRDDKFVQKEIRRKKLELRNKIDLPVARGKDPHVNDRFYKYLVKCVYRFDIFKIFQEYRQVNADMPENLSNKVIEIKGIIDRVLDPSLRRNEKFRMFREFAEERAEEWGIDLSIFLPWQ